MAIKSPHLIQISGDTRALLGELGALPGSVSFDYVINKIHRENIELRAKNEVLEKRIDAIDKIQSMVINMAKQIGEKHG